MANKMADKKKNASRSQVTAVKSTTSEKVQASEKSQVSEKTQASEKVQASEKSQSTKSVKAAPREERKAQPRQENKTGRRESKSSPNLLARVRNNRLGRFAFDAYYELRHKVTWPTFEEARNMTVVVLILSAVIGAILAGADYGLYHLFAFISGVGK